MHKKNVAVPTHLDRPANHTAPMNHSHGQGIRMPHPKINRPLWQAAYQDSGLQSKTNLTGLLRSPGDRANAGNAFDAMRHIFN